MNEIAFTSFWRRYEIGMVPIGPRDKSATSTWPIRIFYPRATQKTTAVLRKFG